MFFRQKSNVNLPAANYSYVNPSQLNTGNELVGKPSRQGSVCYCG